jgi:ATP-dependent Lon protease
MNTLVHGHKNAKEHITRLLAQWIAKPDSKGMILGIHGPAGCGKTTMIKDSICASLGLPFAFIPLGGANDGCYLEGHSYTYEGATWGKVVDVLMKSRCMNPVLFFDELDKISDTSKGEEIINLLIHITDQSQNDKITDKYFSEFEFDLSRCLIIFSYNDEEKISPVLRDRLIKIHTNGYNVKDKISISKNHMIHSILDEYNFKTGDIIFIDSVLKLIIETVEDEQGVRNLRRGLVDIISNINLGRMLELDVVSFPYTVTENDVKKYIHVNNANEKKVPHLMYI